MPQAIIGVIGAVGGTAAVSTAVTVAVYSLTTLATLAYSSSQKRKAKRLDQAKYEASVQDHMLNLQSTTAPRELVLGRTRKGGAAFFQTSVAPYNAVFVSVLALAGHEIDALEEVYFDETPIQLDGDGNVTTAPWGRYNKITVKEVDGNPVRTLAHTPLPGTLSVLAAVQFGTPDYFFPNGASNVAYTLVGNTLTITDPQPGVDYTVTYQWEQFTSTARVFVHLGSPDQAADARMQALLPGTWTADHRARGVAYLECEFVYDDTSFPSGLPNVTAQIRGAKCYDPRTGLTQFSENPAILQRHVLTHPQFGKRTSITAAEDARFVAAANNCDITISYTGLDSVPMFRAALIVPFGAPASDVLDDLAQAMGGEWAYAAGSLFSRAGVYQAPVMHLTDADLAVVQSSNEGGYSQSPIGLNPHKPRNEKFNTVMPRIWDQAARYIQTPLDPIVADALVAADKASLSQEVPMPAVFYAPQARHIAGILIRDARDPMTVTLPFKMRAYPLELFDSITLTLSRYGWVAKEFRILGRVFSPEGFVTLTLKETTAAIFAYGAPFLPNGYADNTGLPRPWDILPPMITSLTSGEDELIVQNDGTIVTAVRVAWAPIQEASIATSGNVEVQWAVLPSGEWQSKVVPGNATEAKFTGVNDLDVIMVRTRSFNKLASSAWGVQLYHQVIGKTAPPPNIENLSISGSVLSWTLPRRVPDLAGYVFRFHYGNNLDWNSAAALHMGLITESPYALVTQPGGVVTIMGKAQDTSGNQSLATANIVMNLGDPPIANILEEWDFDALGWPYDASESTGWTLVGGHPTADALDSLYGTPDQSFYGGGTESFYDLSAYGQMVYVTEPVSISSVLADSIMTLVAQTEGIDLHIDYRLAGPGSFYGPDTESFYEPDTDPMYVPPGAWMPWPGQVIAESDAYQFRVTIGAGTTRGKITGLVLTVDAPDMEEQVPDLAIAAGGTVVPHIKPFTKIVTVQATLQANGSGAVTVEISKTNPLAPSIKAFNAAHAAVSGATADLTLKGY
jgi:Putative phage tail protein